MPFIMPKNTNDKNTIFHLFVRINLQNTNYFIYKLIWFKTKIRHRCQFFEWKQMKYFIWDLNYKWMETSVIVNSQELYATNYYNTQSNSRKPTVSMWLETFSWNLKRMWFITRKQYTTNLQFYKYKNNNKTKAIFQNRWVLFMNIVCCHKRNTL